MSSSDVITEPDNSLSSRYYYNTCIAANTRSSFRFILRASTSEEEMKQLLLRTHPFSRNDVQRSSANNKSIVSQKKRGYGRRSKGKIAMKIVVSGRRGGRRTWPRAIDTTCDNCCASRASRSHAPGQIGESERGRRTPEQAHSAKLTHHITRLTCSARCTSRGREREDAASHAPKTSQRRSPDE